MHFVGSREQKVAVDEVAVEPGAVEQIDPVDDVLEEFDPIGRDQTFDDKLEREPRNAHVLDVVKHGRCSLTTSHRQVENRIAARSWPVTTDIS